MNFFSRLKDTRVTGKDIFYLIVKVLLSIVLCLGSGIILGLILIVVTNKVVDMAIQKIYCVQPLNSSDKNVFYDQESNRCQIMAFIVVERSSEEELRRTFEHKMLSQNVRLRSKIVKIMDTYYFKELTKHELELAAPEVVRIRNDIHSMDELSEYMAKEQNTIIPENTQ